MQLRRLAAIGVLIFSSSCAVGSGVSDANGADSGRGKRGATDSPSSDGGSSSSSSKDASSSAPSSARIPANQIFLFGGRHDLLADHYELGDTWLSDGKTWKLQNPAHTPSPRCGSYAAAIDGVVTLFGGVANVPNASDVFVRTTYDETWTYDGNDWIEQHPAHAPTARFAGASASWKHGLLIFGGDTQDEESTDETWFWDGHDWTQLHPAHSPSARASMTLAPLGESLLLFSGSTHSTLYNDTWIFDGSDWMEQHPAHVPAARTGYGMATLGGAVVLGGGMSGPSAEVSTTWIWSDSDWHGLAPAHAPWSASAYRDQFAMVSTADSVFLFGGNYNDSTIDKWSNDAWTWNGVDWSSRDLGAAPPGRGDDTLLFIP